MELSKEIIEKNFSMFKNWMVNNIGARETEELMSRINENAVMNGTFATEESSGLAYDGSLIQTMFTISKTAKRLNGVMTQITGTNSDSYVDEDSIVKVCFLSQIAKAVMFVPNTSQWEINKGKKYMFVKTDGALRLCERSLLLCTLSGIQFKTDEFEAILALGKDFENDLSAKIYSSPLAYLVKTATDMVVYNSKYFYKPENINNVKS